MATRDLSNDLDDWDRPKPDVTERKMPQGDVSELKHQLEGWRETLLPLNRLLNWDKPYYPALIFCFTTFLFGLIWYFDTSVLTTLSIIGLMMTLTDFLVPIIGPNILGSQTWTGIQERQFDQICERLYNFRHHITSLRDAMCELKTDRPKVYFVIIVGLLSLTAWIGSSIDNLLLLYILGTFVLLLPGLRRHGIIQKYFRNVGSVIKSLLFRKRDPKKTN